MTIFFSFLLLKKKIFLDILDNMWKLIPLPPEKKLSYPPTHKKKSKSIILAMFWKLVSPRKFIWESNSQCCGIWIQGIGEIIWSCKLHPPTWGQCLRKRNLGPCSSLLLCEDTLKALSTRTNPQQMSHLPLPSLWTSQTPRTMSNKFLLFINYSVYCVSVTTAQVNLENV